MKFNQGIPATELRPFSVEDPIGNGPRAQLGPKARVRTPARVPTPPRAPTLRQVNAGKSTTSNAQLPAAKEKKTGWLTVLIIVGLIAAGAQTAVPLLWRLYNQSQLKEQGELAHARIISVTQTNVTINDDRVYAVEAELRLPNHQPFKATVEQSFSAFEVNRLRPEALVEVRYNPELTSEFVITGHAVATPLADEDEPAVIEVKEVDEPAMPREPQAAEQSEPVPAQAAPLKPASENNSAANSDTDRLSCAQARACCRIVSPDNAGCDSYLNPHIPDESCRLALRAYANAATSLGKSCQGF